MYLVIEVQRFKGSGFWVQRFRVDGTIKSHSSDRIPVFTGKTAYLSLR
jgi:hypothetical protein